MDDFSLDLPFTGDSAKALDMLAAALSSEGFEITSRSASQVEFKGPPQPRNYGELSRFWGASTVKVSAKSASLHLAAEMREFQRVNKTAQRIAVGISLMIGIITAATLAVGMDGRLEGAAVATAFTLAFAALIMGLMRQMRLSQETRTRAAYETLFNNAAMLGRHV